ncbi:MAG: hypothetical protein ABEJ31_13265 [Haloarculaceae archaeon]
MYIALYQSHLDKLDEFDVVAYDDDRGTIERGPNHATLAAHVETDADDGDDAADERPRAFTWCGSYLGIGLGGAVAYAASSAGVAPAAMLWPNAVALVVLTAYSLTALAQYATRG